MGPAIAGFFVSAAGNPGSGLDPEQAKQVQAAGGIMGVIVGALGFCLLLLGIPSIVAGIGVLNRRQWGRILTLVLGALSGLSALVNLGGLHVTQALVPAAYCAFVYIILLNQRYAAEFR
jgi:hypothetical protein